MRELLIELLNKLGLARNSYVPSTTIYCAHLNEYTNGKFNFTPIKDDPNTITFQTSGGVRIMHIKYYSEHKNVIESIDILD